MGDASDIEDLLVAHRALERRKKWWGAIKMAMVLASTFFGAGGAATRYLDQLATKDDVARLLAGQKAQLDDIDKRIAMINVRVAVLEERVAGMRGSKP